MGILDSIMGGTPSGSGISAATKALLVVLAAKAAKDYIARRQSEPLGAGVAPGSNGGLGGILGGLLGGGQAVGSPNGGLGSILSGGGLGGLLGGGALGALVDQFTNNGHGNAMSSWISKGPNQNLTPAQIEEALGDGPLQELEAKTGVPREHLLQELSQELPAAVDHITPNGRLPTDAELAAHIQ
jgi:uncharacterized protein YidB (DUF937 family)